MGISLKISFLSGGAAVQAAKTVAAIETTVVMEAAPLAAEAGAGIGVAGVAAFAAPALFLGGDNPIPPLFREREELPATPQVEDAVLGMLLSSGAAVLEEELPNQPLPVRQPQEDWLDYVWRLNLMGFRPETVQVAKVEQTAAGTVQMSAGDAGSSAKSGFAVYPPDEELYAFRFFQEKYGTAWQKYSEVENLQRVFGAATPQQARERVSNLEINYAEAYWLALWLLLATRQHNIPIQERIALGNPFYVSKPCETIYEMRDTDDGLKDMLSKLSLSEWQQIKTFILAALPVEAQAVAQLQSLETDGNTTANHGEPSIMVDWDQVQGSSAPSSAAPKTSKAVKVDAVPNTIWDRVKCLKFW